MRHISTPLLSVHSLSVCALLLLIALSVDAQVAYDGNQTLPPFGAFSGGQFDTVSLQNGNLHIRVPVGSWQQRGGKTCGWRLNTTQPIGRARQP